MQPNRSPRRIMHFTGGTVFGGAEQVLLTTLEQLDSRQWQSTLLIYSCAQLEPLIEAAAAAGVSVVRIPCDHFSALPVRAKRFYERIRECKPDIFHAHLSLPQNAQTALAAASLAGVPAIIATEHLVNGRCSPRALVCQKLVSPHVQRYIAVSQFVADQLRHDWGLPSRKISVVHNGIALHRYQSPARIGKPNSPPLIFTSARLHEQKGLIHLIHAASLVPGARFVVAGDGPDRPLLEHESRKLQLNGRFEFLGHRTDIPDLLRDCDVFVLPSLSEGLPLAVLEAMAAAKPVVATDVGGVREAIRNQTTGVLVPPANAERLAQAIRAVIEDSDYAHHLGESARARAVAEFSAETMVRGVSNIYEQALN